jgi:3-hydroxybenzoate 6-monooxygenase
MAITHLPVLVVGGGLGGASVALARKGLRVCVLEQEGEFGVIGYGIQLGPNAFHMFDRLSVSGEVLKQSIIPRSPFSPDARFSRW